MGAILLDGKNSRHISQRHIILILQPGPQEVKILLLGVYVLLVLPKQAVPLIDEYYKGPSGIRENILHHKGQIPSLHIFRISPL